MLSLESNMQQTFIDSLLVSSWLLITWCRFGLCNQTQHFFFEKVWVQWKKYFQVYLASGALNKTIEITAHSLSNHWHILSNPWCTELSVHRTKCPSHFQEELKSPLLLTDKIPIAFEIRYTERQLQVKISRSFLIVSKVSQLSKCLKFTTFSRGMFCHTCWMQVLEWSSWDFITIRFTKDEIRYYQSIRWL